MGHAQQTSAESVGDPHVPLTVDAQAAIVDSGLEVLGLARIGGRKARDVVNSAIGHPDPFLLVDAEVKWRDKRLAWFCVVTLANDLAFGQITLGKVHELPLLDPQYQDVAARRDDDPLHQTEPAAKVDALRWRQRFSVLIEYRN